MDSLQTKQHAFTKIQQAPLVAQQQMHQIDVMMEDINLKSEYLYQLLDRLKVVSNEGLIGGSKYRLLLKNNLHLLKIWMSVQENYKAKNEVAKD